MRKRVIIGYVVIAIALLVPWIGSQIAQRDEPEYKVYLPYIARPGPNRRFGIAEHTPLEAELLGLARADYISGQWRLPLAGDTAVFLRPTERPHWSTWLLCSWSPRDGWYDKEGCREWIRGHPGMIYVVGNELSHYDRSVGDGYWVSSDQYPRWYHEVWQFIKTEDPTAIVAPYGPIGQSCAGLLLAVWDSYQRQYGELMPADFYPVHHYCGVDTEPWWCWTKLTHWIDWLERHRGTHWDGPKDYWLTEWGLTAWDVPVPQEAALALMEGMILELRSNDIISHHSWWPSGNSQWPDQDTWLVKNGQVTKLGELYYELAVGEIK